MDMGVVIKKYRKEAGMTQEEMANRLGVTTPAVNKWENGNSKPDIELLAPIARLLDISLDTLFSFREKLSDAEIEEIIREDYSRRRGKSKKHMRNMKMLFFPVLVHLILCFPQWLDWHCGKMISVMRDFCQGKYRQLPIHWKWENIMSIRQCLILYVQGKM